MKVGLEFHQRLNTRKLFCNCESTYSEESPYLEIFRYLRPSFSELNTFDLAALAEAARKKKFYYGFQKDSSCLVEADEEPPHNVNPDAFKIVLQIAKAFNCFIFDEIQVMRKIVIDGSNTTGFQRTMLIGVDGVFNSSVGPVPISGVYLEEEACGIGEMGKDYKKFRLDRLGIPLIEISTGLLPPDPAKVKQIALEIGTFLRLTGKVQRGLGTIRQDVNISTDEGGRVEIKGFQDIRNLDKIIEFEVLRQENLKKIWKEKPELKFNILDVSELFKDTKCKFVEKILKSGGSVLCIHLSGFGGLLGRELLPNRRFGTELADYAKQFGLGGIIHSDENLAKYGFSDEIEALKKLLNFDKKDAFILLVEKKELCEKAAQAIIERIKGKAVPDEVRQAIEDGSSAYLRPLPGEARMYPETDVPPIGNVKEILKEFEGQEFENPVKVLEDLKKLGLSEELAEKIMLSKYFVQFKEILKLGVPAQIVASFFENTLPSLKRKNLDISKFTQKHYLELFKALLKNKFSKEALPEVSEKWLMNIDKELDEIISVEKVTKEAIVEKTRQHLEKLKNLPRERQFNVLMGLLMAEFRGKYDGAEIAKIVKEVIENES
ncbi:MAG: Glu-tRNA(Gln) amidotransferase subunit GatE [archaeon]